MLFEEIKLCYDELGKPMPKHVRNCGLPVKVEDAKVDLAVPDKHKMELLMNGRIAQLNAENVLLKAKLKDSSLLKHDESVRSAEHAKKLMED